jgi:hypothetical protein
MARRLPDFAMQHLAGESTVGVKRHTLFNCKDIDDMFGRMW